MPSTIYTDSRPDPNARSMIDSLADLEMPQAEASFQIGPITRGLSFYSGRDGYELQQELNFLSNRAVEPNVFFTGKFLAPAMPRLDDRNIRLCILRDEDSKRSRMRFAMPFSIERPGFGVGTSIIRVWANPFGPLGTPLLDGEGAAETLDNLLEGLARSDSNLPSVLVIPDLPQAGAFASLIRGVAISRNLPIGETALYQRPVLESYLDGPEYLGQALSKEHLRDMQRQTRRLEELGNLTYTVSRQPDEIRDDMEEFLALEASGWKGERRTAMVVDRYRAAFAREAIDNLAQDDNVRIHSLRLDDQPIASMIVFVANGEAYTWKTAYDETYANHSPGKLLMERLTEWHLDDANIVRTDSCGAPDHPIMSRFWKERMAMATLVIGLTPNKDRDVRQVANQLHLYRNTRNVARLIRDKIRGIKRKK